MSADDAPYRPLPAWYWLVERVWRVEHALGRGQGAAADEDTPIRIFFVLVMFAAGFVTLAVGAATRGPVLQRRRARGCYFAGAVARADLVDRNGALLAVDLAHFGLYLDPREVWDTAETRRVLAAALPDVPADRLERALRGEHARLPDRRPDARRRASGCTTSACPASPSRRRSERVYPLGASPPT